MSNWHPKPLRPTDPNPLFTETEGYTIKKSLSPIERQRIADGTPHTKTARTGLHPGNVEPVHAAPTLSLETVSKAQETQPLDVDAVVKSFLSKGVLGQVANAAANVAMTATEKGVSKQDKDEDEKDSE